MRLLHTLEKTMRAPKPLLSMAAFLFLAIQVGNGAEFADRAFTQYHQTTFASAFQRYAKLKNGDGDVHARYSPAAAALGYHSTHGPFNVGFALSYEQGTRKYSGDGYDYKVKSGTPGITLFSGLTTPFGLYVESSTFLGYGTFKGKNYYSPGTGRLGGTGKEHSFLFASYLEAGLILELPLGTVLSPHVGLEYARSPGQTYSWEAGGGRRLSYRSQDSLEASAGLTLASTIRMGVIKITPSLDLTVFDSIGKKNLNYHPGFAYRTAKEWRVAGVGGDHVGGRAKAGLDVSFGEKAQLGVDYSHERRKGYYDHRVTARIGWSF